MQIRQLLQKKFGFCIFLLWMLCLNISAAQFNIEQTISDEAQRNTIAFDGLAFLTGDFCSDTFLPPGKVADFFGFQYLRDNDSDQMGHNTDFLTKIANNMLYTLNDTQKAQLITMAEEQVAKINQYGYQRFPLIKAFCRLLAGDIPSGTNGLNKQAVMDYSAQLYRLDGLISYQRAQVFGSIIRSLNTSQRAYLDRLAATGMLSWPDVGDQLDPRNYTHDVHVAIMTYASEMFSWYAGSIEADTYFCPERQGTYFGSFYLKDMPAMGNPNYTIDSNLTAEKGAAFLNALPYAQAEKVRNLVTLQKSNLYAIVDVRSQISALLRHFMTESSVSQDAVLTLAEQYGELDGEIVYNYATVFAAAGQSLSSTQKANLMELRDLDDYPCSGAYLYSERISSPTIINTDFLFTGDDSGNVDTAIITLNRSHMEFGMLGNLVSGDQTFNITNGGSGTLNWTVSANVSWLTVSPTSGSNAGVVTVKINSSNVNSGTFTGTITVSSANASNSPQTIAVTLKSYNSGSSGAPFGELATPLDGAKVSSSIPVSGWALDDVGVASVKIYNGDTYIGEATFVEGARPDVESAYPGYPNNHKAGWGYMLLTHFLPNGGNGTYTLIAKATDLEGNVSVLGAKTITVDNAHAVKPFGAIDTPTQGGVASGKSYMVWGWTLTPQPNSIATSGANIDVVVDGVKVGHPVYNNYRADIATLFPGYANSNGAVGYYVLNTTSLANGIHTISWSVTDSAGNSDGIGSRYFSVLNTSTDTATDRTTNLDRSTLPVRYDTIPGEESVIYSTELERLEINIKDLIPELSLCTGYLLVGDQLQSLPVGTTLDADKGIFYWQPGPGFSGEYNLVFMGIDASGNYSRQNVVVNIKPKTH